MQNGPVITTMFGGKSYTVRPPQLTYKDLERYILSQRVNPLEIAAKAIQVIPESQHKNIWEAAIKAAANMEVQRHEVEEFEQSPRGHAFKLWHALKNNHPEIDSVDAALALLQTITPEESEAFVAQVKSFSPARSNQ